MTWYTEERKLGAWSPATTEHRPEVKVPDGTRSTFRDGFPVQVPDYLSGLSLTHIAMFLSPEGAFYRYDEATKRAAAEWLRTPGPGVFFLRDEVGLAARSRA